MGMMNKLSLKMFIITDILVITLCIFSSDASAGPWRYPGGEMRGQLPGDTSKDGKVTINEVMAAIYTFLNPTQDNIPPWDFNDDGQFSADERDLVISSFLAWDDNDNDDMVNSWETVHGLNINANDAGEDPDQDGYSNLKEFENRTDPKFAAPGIPASVRAIAGVEQATVSWDAVPTATSYNLYMASEPGVTKSNYATKPDGQKRTGITSPYMVTGLTSGKTYYFVVTASNTGGESGESEEKSATIPLSQLPGPPDDPANNHIPDIPFPNPDEADYHFVEDEFAISFREVLLVFQDTTTVQQANALLSSIDAAITGGIPVVALLLIKLPLTDLDDMITLITTLNADPLVRFALMEMGGAPELLPPYNATPGIWTWDIPGYPGGPATTGNWGLELIRAPQMWNFHTFAQRNSADNQVSAGVVDAGFTNLLAAPGPSTHPDLARLQIGPNIQRSDHGTMVSGIVGSTWNNNLGVEGINPWIHEILGVGSVFQLNDIATWGRQLFRIIALLSNPAVKAVNNSYGLSGTYIGIDRLDDGIRNNSFNPAAINFGDMNGTAAGLGPGGWGPVDLDNPPNGPDTWAQVVERFGAFYNAMAALFVSGAYPVPGITAREDFFIVASAGNAGAGYNAVDNSPIANAAVRYSGHFLTVESINRSNTASTFSDRGGSVSAPGECVRSTEVNNGVNYDKAGCTCIDAGDALYATNSGTSFAAPNVTGLITCLWRLNPDLVYEDVRDLITFPFFTVQTNGGTSPRIDAFASAIGIDIISDDPDKPMHLALIDVDDGTRDGNLRARQFDDDPDPDKIHTPDKRRGDGIITMRDFRTFRDAYLQVDTGEFGDAGLTVILDGVNAHFKKDLNFDGCVGNQKADPEHPAEEDVPEPDSAANAPGEDVFPRYDFNGDGTIKTWRLAAPFKDDPDKAAISILGFEFQDPPGLLRDIDVLGFRQFWTKESNDYSEQVFVDEGSKGANQDTQADIVWDEWLPHLSLLVNLDGDSVGDAGELLADLPDYFHSFDLHISINWAAVNPDYEGIGIKIACEICGDNKDNNFNNITDEPWEEFFRRDRSVSRGYQPDPFIVTIPVWTGKVSIAWGGIDLDDPYPSPGQNGDANWQDVKFGEDRKLVIP